MSEALKTELSGYYEQMLTIRRFEEESARAYAQAKIGGFLHLYIGQEAIAVGAEAVLRPEDHVFQTYRDHGTALARGMQPRAAMAEMFGKDTGCSRGLGGSMHFFDKANRFYGGYGIVGGHVALAAGAAFQSKYNAKPEVTVCYVGDGGVHIGAFHEACSLAGLWNLPLVVVIENNQYAMGTSFERASPTDDLTKKAPGYGMASDKFECHDVMHVKSRMELAVQRAREGGGPTLIEAMTYRFRGHSMSDPGKYRTKEELEARKQRDPLIISETKLRELGMDDASLEVIAQRVEERIQDAVLFADQSEPAKPSVMMESVYTDMSNMQGEQV